ncbi:MAG: hypothetical protein HY553_16120 [Elusimicrobia bacterium]|nr:hypothetical protein [Elusimicrobiota bacterium]
MRTVRIKRQECSEHGTFGVLTADTGFSCVTGELPDKNNQQSISCIPKGTYTVKWGVSPKYGPCYHVQNVPGRSHVLIHPANLMGDKQKGYVAQLEGCIALGKSKETFSPGSIPTLPMKQPQKGVSASKQTVENFVKLLGQQDFQLIIE